MFNFASAFDQDLGWCVDDDLSMSSTFTSTQCEATSCGVEKAPCAVAVATYQPTYKPTYKPSLRGSGCADDADWLYDAGDKGLKGCDYIASEPAKVAKRCSRRVGEDGVPALEACKQTCGKC